MLTYDVTAALPVLAAAAGAIVAVLLAFAAWTIRKELRKPAPEVRDETGASHFSHDGRVFFFSRPSAMKPLIDTCRRVRRIHSPTG